MGETIFTQQQQHLSDSRSLRQANSYPSGQLKVTSFSMVKPPLFSWRKRSRFLNGYDNSVFQPRIQEEGKKSHFGIHAS
jgi:hypothetical protein